MSQVRVTVDHRITTMLDEPTYRRVEFEAEKEKRTKSNWVRNLIEQHFESTDAPTHSGANREPSSSD